MKKWEDFVGCRLAHWEEIVWVTQALSGPGSQFVYSLV